jgi:ribulose-phosphate 3-epimerase
MHYICPTVTAFDVHTYREQLESISRFAGRIHIDLMDGDFAPTMSPSPDQLWIPDDIEVDIHVMYRNPESILERLISFNPSLIIVHAESNADIPELASKLREHNIKTGIALLPETTAESVRYIVPHVQHALIFGGHLGYHGGIADLSQLAKVAELTDMHQPLEFGWDGGASLENCEQLAKAGINIINVGSAIQKSENPENTYVTMRAKVTLI